MIASLLLSVMPMALHADDFDREPINYTTSQPHDCISRLQQRLDKAEATLKHTDHSGYLKSVLSELQVSPTTQMLVFSKTSLQRHRIAPQTPRAIYFNDEVYVGYCQEGEVLEISAEDHDEAVLEMHGRRW